MITFDVRAVLFDMDGTLVDSTPVVERTWTHWALEQGLDPATVIAFAHGRPTADTIRMVRPTIDAVTEAARLLAIEELDPTPSPPIPGAFEAVSIVDRNSRWAVVTSASHRLAEIRLTAAQYPKPGALIAADDIKNGKPDPEGFLRAAQELGVNARDCVVFEDTPAGLMAGQAAGARTVALTTTFPVHELPSGIAVPDLTHVRFRPSRDGWLNVEVLQPL